MTSQCYDYHDIIMYPLINKEFLIKKFSYNTYNLVLTNKFDKIQIATPHSKKMIIIKYNHKMIE